MHPFVRRNTVVRCSLLVVDLPYSLLATRSRTRVSRRRPRPRVRAVARRSSESDLSVAHLSRSAATHSPHPQPTSLTAHSIHTRTATLRLQTVRTLTLGALLLLISGLCTLGFLRRIPLTVSPELRDTSNDSLVPPPPSPTLAIPLAAATSLLGPRSRLAPFRSAILAARSLAVPAASAAALAFSTTQAEPTPPQ